MTNYSPDETYSQIFTEKMWLQGAIVTGVGYGSVLTLFIFGFYLLVRGSTPSNRLRSISLLVYIFVQFTLATLFVAACSDFTQLSFIDNREYPGGPGQYEIDICSLCLIMALPGLGLLASVGVIQLPFPFGHCKFHSHLRIHIVGSEFTLTLLIVTRILLHRRRISKLFGDGQGNEYTGIAAMLIESASLYAAFALFFIIPFGLQSSVQNIAFQALSQIQVIAPFLIIVRVSQGKAWSTDTSRKFSSMEETPRNPANLIELKAMTFSASADTDKESRGERSAGIDGDMSRQSIPV
ncbi:hypothetical protein F5146DRAFT_999926 [Armillaria mellea]|nr:hypothetical protein F5146DRAFT_999926 [Armillaria mellea]